MYFGVCGRKAITKPNRTTLTQTLLWWNKVKLKEGVKLQVI
jgi:hypothetical protein